MFDTMSLAHLPKPAQYEAGLLQIFTYFDGTLTQKLRHVLQELEPRKTERQAP